MTALIFDCDGVLADTERYGHLPAFNATFEQFGLPVRWSEDEYGEQAEDRRRQGADGVAVRRPGAVAAAGLPPTRTADRHARALAQDEDRAVQGPGRRGPAAAPAGHRPDHRRTRCRPAGRSPSRRRRRRSRCGRCWRTPSAPETAARIPGVRRRRRAGQEAGPGDLPAHRRPARAGPGGHAGRRGLPQRAARRDRRRPAVPGDGQRLHPRRGLRRGGAGRARTGRPGPAADRGAGRPGAARARGAPHARRPAECIRVAAPARASDQRSDA